MMNIHNISIEGDGVCDNIFHLLWERDLKNGGSVPSVTIPHTIIFKYKQPTFWYFSSLDGSIKRKTKAKLSAAKIQEELTKKVSTKSLRV
jgi:hypothetical protein